MTEKDLDKIVSHFGKRVFTAKELKTFTNQSNTAGLIEKLSLKRTLFEIKRGVYQFL